MVVFGAQGALGRLCVPALRDAGFEVIRTGRRPEPGADFRLVDLGDAGAVADLCAEADLIVSTVRHPGLAAERYALREGRTLLSIAAFWPAERAELIALEAEPKGQVILDAGLAPGVSSLVLKELLAEHPEADGVESTGTLSIFEPAGRGTAEDTMIAWQGARRLPTRVIDFPPPVGGRRCLRFVSDDAIAVLFGSLAEGRSARAYGCFVERPASAYFLALNSLGLLTRLPEGFFTAGYKWRRGRTTAKAQTHIAAVWQGNRRVAAKSITGSGNYKMSATAIAAFCEVLASRAPGGGGRGVIGVEDAFELAELTAAFSRGGIQIEPFAAAR